MASVRSAYLVLYNSALALGWAHILYRASVALRERGCTAVYGSVQGPLHVWQTAAVMEILHSLTGLVRSPPLTTAFQVGSRLLITWGVLWTTPQVRESVLVTSLILSWAAVEVVRYSFFSLKEVQGTPHPALLWLRYSCFYLLYPTGIASEVGLLWLALPHIQSSEVFSLRMPNSFNFAFDFHLCCCAVLALYVPGGPFMYSHMMAQRKKALGKKEKAN